MKCCSQLMEFHHSFKCQWSSVAVNSKHFRKSPILLKEHLEFLKNKQKIEINQRFPIFFFRSGLHRVTFLNASLSAGWPPGCSCRSLRRWHSRYRCCPHFCVRRRNPLEGIVMVSFVLLHSIGYDVVFSLWVYWFFKYSVTEKHWYSGTKKKMQMLRFCVCSFYLSTIYIYVYELNLFHLM